MAKTVKKIRALVLIVVVLVILAIILVGVFAGSIVKKGVEIGGSAALKVDVTVEDVNVALLRGKIGMKELVVNNPPGYQHETLLEVGELQVNAQMGSLTKETVVIDKIKLDGTTVTLEQKGAKSNLQEIIDALPKSDAEAEERQDEPSKQLLIKEIRIENTTVQAKLLPLEGRADTVKIELDPIILTDVGGEDGVDTVMLTKEILTALAGGIAKQAGGVLPAEMIAGVEDALATGMQMIESGAQVLESGTEALESGGELLEGVKGILGGKKDQK